MKAVGKRQMGWGLLALLVGVVTGVQAGAPSVAVAVEIGAPAPEFKLPSTDGGDIALSGFRGKKVVLLEFYGLDFAPA